MVATMSKQVEVIDRVAHNNGYVTYTVLSSNGKDQYCTTLKDGVATSCTCPAHGSCYHKSQLEAKEEEIAKATLPLMGTPEMKSLISDLEKALGLKPAKKPRRSAKNVELVASLQVAEGVKVRKVRGQAVIVVKSPEKEVEMIEEIAVLPQADSNVSAECPEIVPEANDMSVAEHHLFQDLARYEHSLDGVSLRGLLQDADRAGLVVSDRRIKGEARKALIDHKRDLLEKQHLGTPVVTIPTHKALSKPVQAVKFSSQRRRDEAPLTRNKGFNFMR